MQISAKELQNILQKEIKPSLLDVREDSEFDCAHIEGSQHIPLNQIPDKLNEIDFDTGCVVICHHGVRSLQVANFLIHSGLSNIYNLIGGIDAWSVECDNTVSRY